MFSRSYFRVSIDGSVSDFRLETEQIGAMPPDGFDRRFTQKVRNHALSRHTKILKDFIIDPKFCVNYQYELRNVVFSRYLEL